MIVTLIEKLDLSDNEIRMLRYLSKRGRSFLNSYDKLTIEAAAEKGLIETFYYLRDVNSGYYWRLTKKGKMALKQTNEVIPPNQTKNNLLSRIDNYFTSGGLFNPNMMDHNKVRTLLFDCRDFLLQ